MPYTPNRLPLIKINICFTIFMASLIFSITSFAQDTECLFFDGSDDYISADNGSLNAIGTGNFTVEAWVKGNLADQNAHPTIFSNRPVPGSGVLFFFHNNWGGSAYKMLCIQLGGLNYFVFDNGTYDATFFDGTCHHVAITREDNTLTFYADGVSFGTRTIGAGDPSTASAADLWIGQDDPTVNTFDGNISQVRIWDNVRTEAELNDNKEICIDGSTPNLMAYWELNDGAGQVAEDKTGAADGELGATPSVDSSDPTWTGECCVTCCVGGDPCWTTLSLCEGTAAIDLNGLLCPTATVGGTWSGTGVTGSSFDPTGLSGEIPITYTVGVAPCDSAQTHNITVLTSGPTVNAGPDMTICEGTSITLMADNPSGADLVWDNGVTDGVAFTPGAGTITYTVEASIFGAACSSTDDVTITVNPLPSVAFSAPTTSGCNPLTVNFNNLSSVGAACVWDFGDGETMTSCGAVSHTYSSSGNFDVSLTITSANGCISSVTYPSYVSVVEAPTAAFTPSTSLLEGFNKEVEFTNNSSNADVYEWTFGDDSPNSAETHPTHAYMSEKDGFYEVRLVASSSLSACSDTAITLIRVEDVILIYVPNAVTLDGDVFNQTFKPVIRSGVDYYNYHLTLFNRYGEILFESYNYDVGWNGEYGGQGILQEGVYIWQIEFKETGTDKRQFMRGHLSVLR